MTPCGHSIARSFLRSSRGLYGRPPRRASAKYICTSDWGLQVSDSTRSELVAEIFVRQEQKNVPGLCYQDI